MKCNEYLTLDSRFRKPSCHFSQIHVYFLFPETKKKKKKKTRNIVKSVKLNIDEKRKFHM